MRKLPLGHKKDICKNSLLWDGKAHRGSSIKVLATSRNFMAKSKKSGYTSFSTSQSLKMNLSIVFQVVAKI